jgi:glyoxylase-like metal-dependent hydrolase (beta-lactamase superfamily II)
LYYFLFELMKRPAIIASGKSNGEGVVLHYQTARGTDVFGLGIPNIHLNSDWDLGPTWCYLIVGRKISLIDTGRFGNYAVFESLLKSIGKVFSDIDRIIVTHSHEDHDGNLAEIFPSIQGELWAHSIYRQMISYHPHISDGAKHPEHPGSCRQCIMPEKFYTTCMQYQRRRSLLDIDCAIDGDQSRLGDSLSFIFTPGHCPDALCVVLEDEVIFTGDTILPDITPHPTLSSTFEVNRRILPDSYRYENTVYGLMNYLRSLRKLVRLTPQPIAVFPGHRLFHSGRLKLIDRLCGRAEEIIQFHIDRCSDILRIINSKPAGLDAIAVQHFPESLLSGAGKLMARDELMAHVEVMEKCGDVRWVGQDGDRVQHTGSYNFLDTFDGAKP